MQGKNVNNESQGNDTLRDLLPAYSLGLTDPEESALVESLLANSPEAAAEAAEYQAMAEALLTSAPQIAPPARAFTRLMQAAASPTMPTMPAASPRPGAMPTPAAPLPTTKKTVVTFSWRERLILVAAAAMFMLLFGFNLLALSRLDGLETRLEAQNDLLRLFANDSVVEFTLVDQRERRNEARAFVLCHPDERVGVIRVENFPVTEEAYQIWLWRGDEATAAGMLYVDADGSGTVVVEAPQAFRRYQYAAIEPRDPALQAQITGPLVRGRLYLGGI
ncbi:MAG: hypothetical protein OHK0046_50170 [Anaerolineae bacterium]